MTQFALSQTTTKKYSIIVRNKESLDNNKKREHATEAGGWSNI